MQPPALQPGDAPLPARPAEGDQAPAAPRPPSWRIWAQRVLIVALAAAAVVAVIRNWGTVGPALSRMSGPVVLASALPATLAMLASLGVWRSLMNDLGGALGVRDAARIFYLSQLGKYVPGSVWSILTQVELSRRHGIPKRTNITVGVLAIAVSTTVGLSIAALMLPLSAPAAIRRYWWVMLLIPFMVGSLHPAVLGRSVNLALRVLRRPPLPTPPSWRGLLSAAGWQVLNWLFLGLSAWLLMVGLGAPAIRSLPVAIGGYALAYSLGLLAIPLPAGAGLRDAALAVALTAVLPAGQALLAALVARAVLTFVDLALAGLQYAIGARRT